MASPLPRRIPAAVSRLLQAALCCVLCLAWGMSAWAIGTTATFGPPVPSATGVALDASGHLYVVDSNNGWIVRWTARAATPRRWRPA